VAGICDQLHALNDIGSDLVIFDRRIFSCETTQHEAEWRHSSQSLNTDATLNVMTHEQSDYGAKNQKKSVFHSQIKVEVS
jgi:hypothetical protein